MSLKTYAEVKTTTPPVSVRYFVSFRLVQSLRCTYSAVAELAARGALPEGCGALKDIFSGDQEEKENNKQKTGGKKQKGTKKKTQAQTRS